ncbi:MAG TPA: flavin prenyltransferase UbiX, partial [Chlamydiales bacterium]|nr:flavin prenyltransferase UbiX [Chlamydiales bacterium]
MQIVVGISGASGICLGHLTVRALLDAGHDVHLVMTKDACLTALEEMGHEFSSVTKFIETFGEQKRLHSHTIHDFRAPIASGSFSVDGMIIIPCSMASLAAIAMGLSDNLLRRAADVTLKERRPLVIVPRETPFNDIHLENMLKLSRMGATIVAPIPAWYTRPKTLEDVERFIVGRALDALKIENNLYPKWTGSL